MDRQEKIDFVKDYIEENPNISGNQLLNDLKGTKYSIRKKDFYKIYRETKNIPSQSDTSKYIPKKYRKKPVTSETTITEDEISTRYEFEQNYKPFYEALRMLVTRKGFPQNKHELEYMMYRGGFRKQGMYNKFPTQRQTTLAWNMLRYRKNKK